MSYSAIPLVLIILPIMLSCFPIMLDAKQSVYDSSDRGGALSRSSNDTADSDDVDSGVSPEHVHAQDCLSQMSPSLFFVSFKGLIMA